MSLLSTWSKHTRESLATSGARLSHAQTLEVLAGGLGHRSYASFKELDEQKLPTAHLVVVSADSMVRRAASLQTGLSREACENAVRVLRRQREWPVQHVQELGSFDWIVRSVLSEETHPNRSRIADKYGFNIYGVSVTEVRRPDTPLVEVAAVWCWRGTGDLQLTSEAADWAVQYEAEVSFAKIGRHLLDRGVITDFQPRGEPRRVEFDDVIEEHFSDSDL